MELCVTSKHQGGKGNGARSANTCPAPLTSGPGIGYPHVEQFWLTVFPADPILLFNKTIDISRSFFSFKHFRKKSW